MAKSKVLRNSKKKNGLRYNVGDAGSLNTPSDTFDFISSTNTLEHIPQGDIKKIMRELYRTIKKEGLVSMKIDYQDHWSYFDNNVSPYNFLQYKEQEWKKYNPSLHYQNRMRHSDYLSIFAEVGFQILDDNPYLPNQSQINTLSKLKVSDDFINYDFDDLSILGTYICMRKS